MSLAALVHVTCPTPEAAESIGETVVRERLAAAANVLPGARSIHWWGGELRRREEAVLLLKTRTALVEALTRRVRELHAYECPCVVALPADGGNPDYLAWIERETAFGQSTLS